MNKIGQLLEKHDLRKELAEDKDFIKSVKDLFKEHDIDVDKEKIEEILDNICYSLDKSCELSEDDLNSVAGGLQSVETKEKTEENNVASGGAGQLVTQGKIPQRSTGTKVADIAVKATTTIIGCALGVPFFGATYHSFELEDASGKKTKLSGRSFSMPSAALGAGLGSVVGFKLGKVISRKLGLSPNEETTPGAANATGNP